MPRLAFFTAAVLAEPNLLRRPITLPGGTSSPAHPATTLQKNLFMATAQDSTPEHVKGIPAV